MKIPEEIICDLMEPRSALSGSGGTGFSARKWWWAPSHTNRWETTDLTLDRLRLVEERIMQKADAPPEGCADWGYAIDTALCSVLGDTLQWHWHVSPEDKIAALAAVIQGSLP